MKKLISLLLIITTMFSVVCVSVSSAGTIRLNADFSTMSEADLFSAFVPDMKFFMDSGYLCGYSDAKALQTNYDCDEDTGIFLNNLNTWLTYDMSITLAMADDDAVDYSRFFCVVYCNDNLWSKGLADARNYIDFIYDIDAQMFRLTSGGSASYVEEDQVMDPVPMELTCDEMTFHTMGMSIDKNRIRCFYGNELIFDYDATEYMVADSVNSPLVFWNNGNFVKLQSVVVADQGYLFPYPVDPVPTDTTATDPIPTEPVPTEPVDPSVPTETVPTETVPADPSVPTETVPVDPSVPTETATDTQPIETSETTTAVAEVTDDKGDVVTDDQGEAVTSIITEATTVTQAPAETEGSGVVIGTTVVEVTDEAGAIVTDDQGAAVTSVNNVTSKPAAAVTNQNRPTGGNSTQTGDATFAVIAAMVMALGCAVIVKKVSVR